MPWMKENPRQPRPPASPFRYVHYMDSRGYSVIRPLSHLDELQDVSDCAVYEVDDPSVVVRNLELFVHSGIARGYSITIERTAE